MFARLFDSNVAFTRSLFLLAIVSQLCGTGFANERPNILLIISEEKKSKTDRLDWRHIKSSLTTCL